LESADSEIVLRSFHDITKPGGAAALLVQCLRDQRCDACFAGPSDAGTRRRDGGAIFDAPEAGGEVGAESGTEPPRPVCGDGKIEGTETCDNGDRYGSGAPYKRCVVVKAGQQVDCDSCSAACTDDTACNACLADPNSGCPEFLTACADVGNDTDEGKEKIRLCDKLYACITQKGCADPMIRTDPLACYCGARIMAMPDPEAACVVKNAAQGDCKEEIENAFGTQDPTEILTKFTEVATPGGAALSLALCEVAVCADACYYGRLKRPKPRDAGAP